MKILHILKTPPGESTRRIIEAHRAGTHEVKIVDISKGGVDHAGLVADVFAYDKVFTW